VDFKQRKKGSLYLAWAIYNPKISAVKIRQFELMKYTTISGGVNYSFCSYK